MTFVLFFLVLLVVSISPINALEHLPLPFGDETDTVALHYDLVRDFDEFGRLVRSWMPEEHASRMAFAFMGMERHVNQSDVIVAAVTTNLFMPRKKNQSPENKAANSFCFRFDLHYPSFNKINMQPVFFLEFDQLASGFDVRVIRLHNRLYFLTYFQPETMGEMLQNFLYPVDQIQQLKIRCIPSLQKNCSNVLHVHYKNSGWIEHPLSPHRAFMIFTLDPLQSFDCTLPTPPHKFIECVFLQEDQPSKPNFFNPRRPNNNKLVPYRVRCGSQFQQIEPHWYVGFAHRIYTGTSHDSYVVVVQYRSTEDDIVVRAMVGPLDLPCQFDSSSGELFSDPTSFIYDHNLKLGLLTITGGCLPENYKMLLYRVHGLDKLVEKVRATQEFAPAAEDLFFEKFTTAQDKLYRANTTLQDINKKKCREWRQRRSMM